MKLLYWIRHGIIRLRALCYRGLDWMAEHRELVTYAIVGVLTTAVDWVISFLLYRTDMNTHVINVMAWTAAVLFAFTANKRWVFRSETRRAGRVTAELIAFAGGRVLSLGVQEALFVLLVDVMSWQRHIVKIPVAVLVVIINYFLTRVVFLRKTDSDAEVDKRASAPTTDARVQGRRIVIGGDSSASPSSDEDDG